MGMRASPPARTASGVRIDVVTIFPDYLAPLGMSLLGKAQERGLIDVVTHDLRTWASDPHRSVDDTPYGGGPGMVMRPEPWGRALDELAPRDVEPPLCSSYPRRPGGRSARRWRHSSPPSHGCCSGAGGTRGSTAASSTRREPACGSSRSPWATTSSVAKPPSWSSSRRGRLLPGVVGNAASLVDESHAASSGGLLEAPVFTKPASWRGHDVPDVLLSGHHGAIVRWRRDQALRRTAANRPDLLQRLDPTGLDRRDLEVLAEEGQSPASP